MNNKKENKGIITCICDRCRMPYPALPSEKNKNDYLCPKCLKEIPPRNTSKKAPDVALTTKGYTQGKDYTVHLDGDNNNSSPENCWIFDKSVGKKVEHLAAKIRFDERGIPYSQSIPKAAIESKAHFLPCTDNAIVADREQLDREIREADFIAHLKETGEIK